MINFRETEKDITLKNICEKISDECEYITFCKFFKYLVKRNHNIAIEQDILEIFMSKDSDETEGFIKFCNEINTEIVPWLVKHGFLD